MAAQDRERIDRNAKALAAEGLDAIVCALPANVLLLSGYWPVVGTAIAAATRDGGVGIAVPEDEKDLAADSWADVTRTFPGASLDNLDSAVAAVRDPLREVARCLGIRPGATVGFEGGASFFPSTYASAFVYGAGIREVLNASLAGAISVDATELLARLRSVLTVRELGFVRRACQIAGEAYAAAAADIRVGMPEFEAAAILRKRALAIGPQDERRTGFAYCMSGPDSYEAFAAFQRSRSRQIASGDFVLLHCNSSYRGYWTDVTRTYTMSAPDADQMAIGSAVLEAGRRAIDAVRPSVPACAVDRAAREVMESRGFGKAFKHATGHGVGFAAIDHNARPRIHPLSDEALEPGMVFNIEPAAYIEGIGGMRQCNMVAVTRDGAELLTGFQNTADELALDLSLAHR